MALKISVIMPVYNCNNYVADSVKSILNQSFNDFELIIIDGGSSDGTLNTIQNLNDERIVLIEHGKRIPIVESLNEGILAAKGDLIARQDADDISHFQRLAKQYEHFRTDTNLAVLGTAYFCIDQNGRCIEKAVPKRHIEFVDFNHSNKLCHGSVMFRKDIVVKAGLYDPLFRTVEDYELWCRLSNKKYRIENLSEFLYFLRLHIASFSERNYQESILRHCLVEEVYFGNLEKTKIDASSSSDLKYLYSLLSTESRKDYHKHVISNLMKSKKYLKELKEFWSLAKLDPKESSSLLRRIIFERMRLNC